MMSQWIISGLKTGIKTSAYPEGAENSPGITPGMPLGRACPPTEAEDIVQRCPVQALGYDEGTINVDRRRCIHCRRCHRGPGHPLDWESSYEWAASVGHQGPLKPSFERSIHIVVVDAGDCGACLHEVKQLNNPYYNMHRLGFFVTPAPRQADVLLVVGPVTEHMHVALRKVYDAMPEPKRVIAVGACALSGGVFADSFMCPTRLGDLLPVDVEVPGHPPPPLAILHALLVAVGRKPAAELHPEFGRE